MISKLDARRPRRHVDELLALLDQATDPREVELIAESLAEAGDARAVRPLLMHLGESQVRQDADVEEAVCRALIALGVMCTYGDHSFRLRPRQALGADAVAAVRECSGTIPWQYFGTRSVY